MSTYHDIYREFSKKFPNYEVDDYRPADLSLVLKEVNCTIPNAIIVWLKNGEKLVYVSKEEGQEGRRMERCVRMTIENILEYYKDINYMYNDAGRYDDLKKMLNKLINDIKEELHENAEMHSDGDYYLREEWVDEIIDDYIGKESE